MISPIGGIPPIPFSQSSTPPKQLVDDINQFNADLKATPNPPTGDQVNNLIKEADNIKSTLTNLAGSDSNAAHMLHDFKEVSDVLNNNHDVYDANLCMNGTAGPQISAKFNSWETGGVYQ